MGGSGGGGGSMAAGGFARLMHREPIVVWSVGIGTVGLLMPLVVPALRDMFGFGALDVRPLPKPLEVAAKMRPGA